MAASTDDDTLCKCCYARDGVVGECGHVFCIECQVQYYTVNPIRVDGLIVLKCLQDGCDARLSHQAAEAILPERLFNIYDRSMVLRFLQDVDNVVHCPDQVCEATFILDNDARQGKDCAVECPECTKPICVVCKSAYHPTMECYQAIERRSDVDVTNWRSLRWKRRNARRCPHCDRAVQKDGGCRHMSCECGREWCWLCGEDFHAHKTLACWAGYDTDLHREFKLYVIGGSAVVGFAVTGLALLALPETFVAGAAIPHVMGVDEVRRAGSEAMAMLPMGNLLVSLAKACVLPAAAYAFMNS